MIRSSFHTPSTTDPGDQNTNRHQELELATAGSYTREELYELVWQQPMTKLVPLLGVSTTTISLACKAQHIPVPPRGFWSKVRTGKQAKRTSLPDRPPGMSNSVRIGRPRNLNATSLACMQPRFPQSIENLRAQVLKSVSKMFQGSQVARSASKRMDRIWHYLFKIVAEFGGVTDADGQHCSSATIHIHNQAIDVRIASIEAHQTNSGSFNPARPQGLKLTLSKLASKAEIWKTWQDEDNARLETHLAEIATEIVVLAEVRQREAELAHFEWLVRQRSDRQDRIAGEERGRQRDMEQQESVRLAALLAYAKDLENANILRQLRTEVETTFAEHTDLRIHQWLELVSTEITKLDPLCGKRFLDVLDAASELDQPTRKAA